MPIRHGPTVSPASTFPSLTAEDDTEMDFDPQCSQYQVCCMHIKVFCVSLAALDIGLHAIDFIKDVTNSHYGSCAIRGSVLCSGSHFAMGSKCWSAGRLLIVIGFALGLYKLHEKLMLPFIVMSGLRSLCMLSWVFFFIVMLCSSVDNDILHHYPQFAYISRQLGARTGITFVVKLAIIDGLRMERVAVVPLMLIVIATQCALFIADVYVLAKFLICAKFIQKQKQFRLSGLVPRKPPSSPQYGHSSTPLTPLEIFSTPSSALHIFPPPPPFTNHHDYLAPPTDSTTTHNIPAAPPAYSSLGFYRTISSRPFTGHRRISLLHSNSDL